MLFSQQASADNAPVDEQDFTDFPGIDSSNRAYPWIVSAHRLLQLDQTRLWDTDGILKVGALTGCISLKVVRRGNKVPLTGFGNVAE